MIPGECMMTVHFVDLCDEGNGQKCVKCFEKLQSRLQSSPVAALVPKQNDKDNQ